jgi:hypothetical protein
MDEAAEMRRRLPKTVDRIGEARLRRAAQIRASGRRRDVWRYGLMGAGPLAGC